MKEVECKQVRILTVDELELVNGGGLFDSVSRAFNSVREAVRDIGGCGGTAKDFHDIFTKGGTSAGRDNRNWSGGCNSRASSRGFSRKDK